MRNATSICLFGASALALTLLGACGGSGGDGSRDMSTAGTASNNTSGSGTTSAGTSNASSGSSSGGSSATGGSSSGGAPACNPVPGPKKGDGTNQVIDELDDTNTMFAPAGVGMGAWDFSKDASMGTIMPAGTMALMPVTGGHMGSALHVQGTALTGWGASLAAFLNGSMSSFDASAYGGVAFWIKGTTTVQEGMNKLMVQARMPDVLPGAGTCCDDKVKGAECYSGHRVVIDVGADWHEVKIAWTDFKGPAWGLGSTLAFNANRVRDINFSFNHDTDPMTKDPATAFDVWVDGLRFMGKDEMSNIGTTGGGGSSAGGSSAGGSGGAAAGGGGSSAGGTGGTQ